MTGTQDNSRFRLPLLYEALLVVSAIPLLLGGGLAGIAALTTLMLGDLHVAALFAALTIALLLSAAGLLMRSRACAAWATRLWLLALGVQLSEPAWRSLGPGGWEDLMFRLAITLVLLAISAAVLHVVRRATRRSRHTDEPIAVGTLTVEPTDVPQQDDAPRT